MCAQLLVHNSKVGLNGFQREDGRFGHDEVKKTKKGLNCTFLFHNVPLNSSISPVFFFTSIFNSRPLYCSGTQ